MVVGMKTDKAGGATAVAGCAAVGGDWLDAESPAG